MKQDIQKAAMLVESNMAQVDDYLFIACDGIVAVLMWKSGMLAKPISKEKYEQCYGEKK